MKIEGIFKTKFVISEVFQLQNLHVWTILIRKGSMSSYHKEFWVVYPESKITETLIFKDLGLASSIYASSVKKVVKDI